MRFARRLEIIIIKTESVLVFTVNKGKPFDFPCSFCSFSLIPKITLGYELDQIKFTWFFFDLKKKLMRENCASNTLYVCVSRLKTQTRVQIQITNLCTFCLF